MAGLLSTLYLLAAFFLHHHLLSVDYPMIQPDPDPGRGRSNANPILPMPITSLEFSNYQKIKLAIIKSWWYRGSHARNDPSVRRIITENYRPPYLFVAKLPCLTNIIVPDGRSRIMPAIITTWDDEMATASPPPPLRSLQQSPRSSRQAFLKLYITFQHSTLSHVLVEPKKR